MSPNIKDVNNAIREVKSLREAGANLAQQAKSFQEQAAELEAKLRLARGTGDHAQQAQQVTNPFWVGDATDATTLKNAVQRCLTGTAKTLRELIDLTGARRNRVSAAIVQLQVDRVPVRNLGDQYRAIWYIPEQRNAHRIKSRNVDR